MVSSSSKLTKVEQPLNSGGSKWHTLPVELMGEIYMNLEPKDIARMNHPMWFSISSDRFLFASPATERIFSVKHRHSLPIISYSSSTNHLMTLVGGKTVFGCSTWPPDLCLTFLNYPRILSLFNRLLVGLLVVICLQLLQLVDTQKKSLYPSPVTSLDGYHNVTVVSNLFSLQAILLLFLKGDFIYCLDVSCLLGIFDMDKEVWRVLHPSISWSLYAYQSCHLISTADDIYALIVNKEHKHPPIMLCLSLEKQNWEQVRSLGGKIVFTGGPTSSVVVDVKPMIDRIYLPSLLGCSYDLCEAKISLSEGQIYFFVDNVIKPKMKMTWWLLDDNNMIKVCIGYPSRKRESDFFIGKHMLPYGTWIGFKLIEDPYVLALPSGPATGAERKGGQE